MGSRIGLGVGIGVGGACIVAATIFFIVLHRRHRRDGTGNTASVYSEIALDTTVSAGFPKAELDADRREVDRKNSKVELPGEQVVYHEVHG